MIPYQLDLFETQEQSQMKAIEKTVLDVKESLNKVRRKLFANNGELYQIMKDFDERLKIIEKHLCKGNADIVELDVSNFSIISEKLEKVAENS